MTTKKQYRYSLAIEDLQGGYSVIADQSEDETEAGYSDEYVFDEIVLDEQN